VVWWPSGSRRLGSSARELIMADTTELFVSAATWWELAIKRSLGDLNIDLASTRQALEKRAVRNIAVTFDHAEAAAILPFHHRDPFDRMLVAQASVEQLVLLTRDKQLASYGPMVLAV
jgi:PIN domain nuclease of toxin-antitoxin system